MLQLYSYGAKTKQVDEVKDIVDIILPCHYVMNPHGIPSLRHLTGQDEEIQSFVWSDSAARAIYNQALEAVHNGLTSLAFECYGGRHRSVALAEIVCEKLRDLGYRVHVNHLSLGVSYEAR